MPKFLRLALLLAWSVSTFYFIYLAIRNVFEFSYLIFKYKDNPAVEITTSGIVMNVIYIIINILLATFLALSAIKVWKSTSAKKVTE